MLLNFICQLSKISFIYEILDLRNIYFTGIYISMTHPFILLDWRKLLKPQNEESCNINLMSHFKNFT